MSGEKIDSDRFSAGSFAALQELTKKNFAAFNQALAMFSPFVPATPATDSSPKKANSEDDIGQLRDQRLRSRPGEGQGPAIDDLQQQQRPEPGQ